MIYTNRKETLPENIERDYEKINKPAVSVTLMILTPGENSFDVLLIKRLRKPYVDMWSLPGDIIALDESLDESAQRVLLEKTGAKNFYMEQLYTFGEPDRDPRGRLITVAYLCLLPSKNIFEDSRDTILEKKWSKVTSLPALAFDHKRMIEFGLDRIANKIEYTNIAKDLLPSSFRLIELQHIFEIALKEKIDKRNFQKWIKKQNMITPTGEVYKLGHHRPAKLYKFISNKLTFIK